MDEYFTGQHEKILLRGPDNVRSLVVGEENYTVKGKHFTELDRLSCVVELVGQDCSVVPVGAYKMIPTHELTRNPNFRGLKIDQSRLL